MTGTGDVETTGGYSTSSDTTYIAFGLGAGIGGGGTYSSNGDSVTGGKIASATFSGAQLITSLGGYGFDTRGSGAGIGGGGLCITNSPSTLNVGELESLAVNTNANKRTLLTAVAETLYGQGAEVGNGGLYRQATRENGAEYDDLPPVIISNLYSGEKVTVTAQDSNIGLWKISTSTDPRGPIEDDVYFFIKFSHHIM